MAKKVKPIPTGYNSLTSYISVRGGAKAIEFYKKVFDAKEIGRLSMPDGTVTHAELAIGDSKLWLADENPQWGNLSPLALNGSSVSLCLYVEDADKVFTEALKQGAKVIGDMVVKDQFYGDRAGSFIDPFGHKWTVMTHIEDVSFEEMKKRADAMFSDNK
jgi:PhnB protein